MGDRTESSPLWLASSHSIVDYIDDEIVEYLNSFYMLVNSSRNYLQLRVERLVQKPPTVAIVAARNHQKYNEGADNHRSRPPDANCFEQFLSILLFRKYAPFRQRTASTLPLRPQRSLPNAKGDIIVILSD